MLGLLASLASRALPLFSNLISRGASFIGNLIGKGKNVVDTVSNVVETGKNVYDAAKGALGSVLPNSETYQKVVSKLDPVVSAVSSGVGKVRQVVGDVSSKLGQKTLDKQDMTATVMKPTTQASPEVAQAVVNADPKAVLMKKNVNKNKFQV